MGLRGKLLLSVCSVLLVSLTISISVITYQSFEASRVGAMQATKAMARQFGTGIQLEMERGLGAARTMAQGFSGLKGSGKALSREAGIELVRQVLEQNPAFMGAWTVWAPDAYDGRDAAFAGQEGHDETGRFIPYWNRVGGVHLEACVEYEDNTQTGYYTGPMATGREVILDPATYKIGGKDVTVVSACAPIVVRGRTVGVAGVDFSMERMRELVLGIRLYEHGYGSLATGSGMIVAHPKEELVGEKIDKFFSPEVLRRIASGKETEEEILAQVASHAKSHHQIDEVPQALIDKALAAITEE